MIIKKILIVLITLGILACENDEIIETNHKKITEGKWNFKTNATSRYQLDLDDYLTIDFKEDNTFEITESIDDNLRYAYGNWSLDSEEKKITFSTIEHKIPELDEHIFYMFSKSILKSITNFQPNYTEPTTNTWLIEKLKKDSFVIYKESIFDENIRSFKIFLQKIPN
ncbi:hypothetical protein [Wenyingzhuangia sp. IMCC45467]